MKKLNCLIVDDDLLQREILMLMLSGYGEFTQACNGAEAVERYRTSVEKGAPFDIIFLDVMMPVMNGHEAAKTIRSDEENRGITPDNGVTIIIMSCLDSPKDIVQSYISAQSSAHLIKPVKREKLIKTLQQLELIEPTVSQ